MSKVGKHDSGSLAAELSEHSDSLTVAIGLYRATVRIRGRLIKTAVFAETAADARVLIAAQYRVDPSAINPVRVDVEHYNKVSEQAVIPSSSLLPHF